MKRLIYATVVLACMFMLSPLVDDAEAGGLRHLRQDRLEIGRGMLEVQNVDWTTLLRYYGDDIEYHCPVVDVYGIGMVTQFLGRLFGSSPDLVTTVEDETLVGDVYSATWTMVGTFVGVPYEAKGISIIKFRRWSREVYYWRDYYTEGDIMSNIPGLDEAIVGIPHVLPVRRRSNLRLPLRSSHGRRRARNETPGRRAGTAHVRLRYPFSDQVAPGSARDRTRAHREQRHELAIAAALLHQRHEYHDPIVDIYGFDTLVPFFERLFVSSPDLITTVEDEMLIDGVYTATWTMVGQFNGVPYSGKGMSILKFRERSTQTYYSRDYYSEGDIMATIPGLDQAVAGFRVFYRSVVDPAFDGPVPPLATLEADGR